MFGNASSRQVFWWGVGFALIGLFGTTAVNAVLNDLTDYGGMGAWVDLYLPIERAATGFLLPLGTLLIAVSIVLARLDRYRANDARVATAEADRSL